MHEIEPGSAILVDWTAERYHSDRETTSRGQLLDLLDRPSRYYLVHETRTLPSPAQTKALRIGTAVHVAALEQADFIRRVFVPGKRGRDRLGRPKQQDAIELSLDECGMVVGLATSFRAHPFVQVMLEAAHRFEQTILWRPAVELELDAQQRERLGPEVVARIEAELAQLLVRVRADALIDLDETTVVVLDIKTDADAPSSKAFARTITKHRYYLQAAMYRDAVAAAYPGREVHFVFVALAKSAPYEAACYDLDADALELGRNQYRDAMVDLVRRRVTGDWTADWQRSVHTLSLPRWATR